MDKAAYSQFTTTAADMAKSVVEKQIEMFDMLASSTKGTPAAPFFDAAAKMQRATLDGFKSLSDAIVATPSKATAAKAKNDVAKTMKVAEKAMKKAVNAQADMLAEAGSEAVAATSKTTAAVEKAAKSAASGDMAALYDDLTAVTGIGPSTMKKLQANGVRTIADLATTSNKDLTAIIESANIRMLKHSPADWIASAKALVKSSKAA